MRNGAFVRGALACAFLFIAAPDASACGGCFHNPAVDSVVTGHRMAFAVSADRTVLWDQIKYSGDPGDFGWVLPVEPGAVLELSTDAFFEALETATSTQIAPPQLVCAQSSGSGVGCGSSDSAASGQTVGDFAHGGPQVTVLHQGSLGPFDTATLRSDDSGALRTWLSSHGYAIQQDVDPIIDAYVDEKMDFIALRLNGTAPMQPVRVVTPNGHAVLPLRMVMAGTGSSVDVVLYAIGETRLGLADLTEVELDLSKLTFDFAANTTNYETLREDTLSQHLGASFLTTFATKNPFDRNVTRTLTTSGGRPSQQLGQLYFDQGFENEAVQEGACSLSLVGLTGDTLVDETAATAFTCGDLSDISAAMIGMHPSRVWMSRMEMTLPRDVLGMDCRVNDDPAQKEVSNDLTAVHGKNAPCAQPIFASHVARGNGTSPALAFGWAMAGMALVTLVRRGRRRR
jgi:hypothetical protein